MTSSYGMIAHSYPASSLRCTLNHQDNTPIPAQATPRAADDKAHEEQRDSSRPTAAHPPGPVLPSLPQGERCQQSGRGTLLSHPRTATKI